MKIRQAASTITLVSALTIATPFAHAARTAQRSGTEVLGDRLGRAVALLDEDPKAAAKLLRALETDSDLLEDVVLYFLALAQTQTKPSDAASTLDTLLTRHPESIVSARAAALLGELLVTEGKTERLTEIADRYAKSTRRSEESARLTLATAKALAEGKPKEAVEYLQRTRRQGAGMSSAKDARALLTDLRSKHPELRPHTADDLYQEAVLAGIDGETKVQIELLDRFIAAYPSHSKATDVLLMRAKTIARTKGKLEAAAWLRDRATKASNKRTKAKLLFQAASYAWNGHDSVAARRDFEAMLALQSRISSEQRAHYALGRLHESAKRYNAAASSYRKASSGSDVGVALESQWRAGWASYLAGNFMGAAWVFGNMAEDGRNARRGQPSGREEALYWEARSLERAERRAEATGAYRTVIKEYPDGFYAYLAERRTGLTADAPVVASIDDRGAISEQAERVLSRARALHIAKLEQLAAREIDTGLDGVDGPVLRRVLPQILELGAFNTALRTSLSLYRRGLLEENQLYPFLYPSAFDSIVQTEAQSRGLDPYLVYSLMRQESLFDRFAVSPADAYGLMQLLLPTANRMAKKTGGEPVEADDLFEPRTNIRLGTTYLAELAARFDNDPVLMLAGYNAGETAAERWKSTLSGMELDEFIENITYRETRGYVKKILRNYRNYLRLYGQLGTRTTAELADQAPRQ